MRKGLFFSLPSVSVHHTLTPFVAAMAASGYQMRCYNTEAFRPAGPGALQFSPYPSYQGGYNTDSMEVDSSYFKFGEVLADTAESLMDFLIEEVEREKPDFILHSHLAVWGNLVARHFKLPTVTLFTTFILDGRIMLSEVRKRNAGHGVDFSNISQGKLFYQKLQQLYNRLQLPGKINIWDIYVNKGNLNLAFILEAFQPRPEILGDGYHFVGFPLPVEAAPRPKDVIYVALGTVFNNEAAFYRMCIEVLKSFPRPCVLSVGKKIDRSLLGELPDHIRVEAFTDQVEVLKKTAVFITRGGMASVHEAVHTRTPMIVIPTIPEQQLTAAGVEALGIGLRLAAGDLTEAVLRAAIHRVLDNQDWYAENLRVLLAGKPPLPAIDLAHRLLDDYLQKELQPQLS